ncbi:MAG: hypothetical protein G01um10145_709 [Microgenomates group bacterium Gr01-1014_5]|nr:MAG: hypothetical protein G01um10145_709 [Microgenomates group bacterium Gr01-1014_5]
MTFTVSISQFREQIADYIAKAKEGHTVILKDEKKDQEIVQLVRTKEFNPETFGKALEDASGVFMREDHPEWRTKNDVIRWLKQSRKASDRNF